MTKNDPTSNYVNRDEYDRTNKTTYLLLTGVLIVLFIGFATLFFTAIAPIIESWKFQGSTYQNLVNQINSQNTKIDFLIQQIAK
ncbi:MAG: hypothetical protein WAV10_03955 [Minisyncoccia bacterium]